MAEWLILLLLVPAIVVPVVMLVGFAGCSFPHGVGVGPGPVMVSADATSDTAITLTWKYDEPAAGFLIERKQLSNGATGGELLGSSTTYIDTNLRAATTYEYTVRAIHLDEMRSNPSLPERGTTRLANLLHRRRRMGGLVSCTTHRAGSIIRAIQRHEHHADSSRLLCQRGFDRQGLHFASRRGW